MSLLFSHPEDQVHQITTFIQKIFSRAKKSDAVIAVSGGIDSALSLALVVKALGVDHVTAVLLPHHLQPMEDARVIVEHLALPSKNIVEIDIQPIVATAATSLQVAENEVVRLGNLKARARMMCIFDMAKKKNALVCGTENKSEHYLGYFTRFGDAASDLEPISHLYKTQVRQLVEFLQLPKVFLEKAPSAGLWLGQTDEQEMGFSYVQADQVLEQLIDQKKNVSEVQIEGISRETIEKIARQVEAMQFKLEVPYILEK